MFSSKFDSITLSVDLQSPTYHPKRLRINSSRVSLPKRHLDRLAVLHSTSVWIAHRHIDHATCDIRSKRPHRMHYVVGMRP